MQGSIHFDGQTVDFAFGVPLPPDTRPGVSLRVLFEISSVERFSQRRTPDPGTMIGLLDGGWADAQPGISYERLGIYLGQNQVLTAHWPHSRG